jgi:serine/threonine protein kinase
LKPDNLLLRSGDKSAIESSDIILIDFGVSRPFLDDAGDHLPLKEGVPFSGNLMFQSHNAFKRVTLSRRDDLISLCYLMTFLFNGGFDWVEEL